MFNIIKPLLLFSHSVVTYSLCPCGLRHIKLPCPSPWPEPCSNSCPLSQWCDSTISSSVIPLSHSVQFSSVHSVVSDSLRPHELQHSLSITNSRSSLKLMSIESVMPSSHLILCRPLLLLPLVPPSIRVFSNESTLLMRSPKYWSFSFSIILPKNTQDWAPLGWTGWISLQSKGRSRVFSSTTVQKHQFFSAQFYSQSNSHIHTWPQEKP